MNSSELKWTPERNRTDSSTKKVRTCFSTHSILLIGIHGEKKRLQKLVRKTYQSFSRLATPLAIGAT